MNYQAVIWDLGGVLVRTDDPLPRQALAQRLGHTRASLDQLVFGGESSRRAQLGELTEQQHWENVRQMLGLQIEALSEFQREFWGGDRLDHELVDFIRSLRRDYRTGLLSNNFSSLRSNLSTHWQIADAFDVIVISSEVHLLKPDARIYQLRLTNCRFNLSRLYSSMTSLKTSMALKQQACRWCIFKIHDRLKQS